jgi:RimJ/RimL family protein N-acetyltransferase
MFPEVTLSPTTREDVQRLADWLDDPEVSSSWYGQGEDGTPLHIGYAPRQILQTSQAEWDHVFENEDRQIYSFHTSDGDHIGEGQLVVEWPLLEAQVFILIGRKDLWHHHYGTMALIHLLDQAFQAHGLHRVWADIPDYNEHALSMFRHLGFVLEGHLRKTHRKDGEWYDSHAMGLLTDEYNRRRSRLMGSASA